MAPNGKLPAASILDSKGIVLNKEDRVSVEKDSDETILRVRRVTHGEETRTVRDSVLHPDHHRLRIWLKGRPMMRQQGVNGEKTQVYDVTYVDGVAESETLKSETVTSMAIDQIIAVGAAKSDTDKGSDKKSDSADNGKADSGSNNQHESSNNNAGNTGEQQTPATPAIPVTLATPVTPATPATLVTPAAVRTTIPALLAPIQAQPPRPPAACGTPP